MAERIPLVGSRDGSCVGDVTMLDGAGRQVPVALYSPPALTIAVGDVLGLMATGPCFAAVWMSPQRDGLFVVAAGNVLSANRLRAVRPGTVRVDVAHWVCVERPTYDPTCRDLVALDGYVDVIVVPALP